MAILYLWSGAAGSGSGADWTNAKTTFAAALTTEAAGDTIYVAHDHAESTASGTYTSSGTLANPTKVICVDRAGTVPPVSADRRATAQITLTSGSMLLAGVTHYDGIIFINTAGGIFLPHGDTQWIRMDNCSLRLNHAVGSLITTSNTIGGQYIEWNNTTVSFGAVGQAIQPVGTLRWRNTPSALLGAAVPTILFNPIATRGVGASIECVGVDLSAAGSGKTIIGTSSTSGAFVGRFVDCKLNASVTKSSVPSSPGGLVADFIRSGSAGNYTVFRQRITGTLTEETTIVRSGGASDGTTPIAWKVVTTANCNYSLPFECPPIAIWNDTVGSAVTATVEGIAATLPTDGEVWLEVSYLSDASSPISSAVNDGKANLIIAAANQTSSSETWGGSTTAFKLAVTFTAQQAGWIYGRLKVGKASSTVYLDPLISLT